MNLIYQNLTIRNATNEDATILAQWWNDGKVMAHAGFPNGLNTTPETIIQQIATDSDETRRRLIIEYMNRPIGEMSYRNIGNNEVEIGIKICDFNQQNKGLGKIILSMLISELFKSYDKIILDTNLKNERAQHVYEQLGFTKLRINKNAWKDQLGVSQTSIDYELVQKDFNNYINKEKG